MNFWQLKNPTYMYQNITVKYVMKLKDARNSNN